MQHIRIKNSFDPLVTGLSFKRCVCALCVSSAITHTHTLQQCFAASSCVLCSTVHTCFAAGHFGCQLRSRPKLCSNMPVTALQQFCALQHTTGHNPSSFFGALACSQLLRLLGPSPCEKRLVATLFHFAGNIIHLGCKALLSTCAAKHYYPLVLQSTIIHLCCKALLSTPAAKQYYSLCVL